VLRAHPLLQIHVAEQRTPDLALAPHPRPGWSRRPLGPA
jgi:hypothetical protein